MSSPTRRHANYGRGEHRLDELTSENLDGVALRQALVQVFGDRKFNAPVLPAAAYEVMSLSRRTNVSFEDVLRIVEKDSTIAGRVLQVAQSPLYASRVKPRTLRHAVQRLGLNSIRDIVWQVALDMRVFRAPAYDSIMKSVQRHSVATAHISRLVCGYTAVSAEYAFLCGLLHDVGLAGLLIALAEQNRSEPPPSVDLMWAALSEVHAEASGYLVRSWRVDSDLETVVAQHHAFDGERFPHPLVAVLCASEFLVNSRGFGVLPGDPMEVLFDRCNEDQVQSAFQVLGLSPAVLQTLDGEVDETLGQHMPV